MQFFNDRKVLNCTCYRKVLRYYFRVNGHFWLICVFFFIVWYVTATSSWIFTPNVEKCDFKYLF